MDKNFFSIGEVSRLKGITKKALRFYEKIGLLMPHHTDPANGYRYYSWEQFILMDIIKAMRILDISPLAIKKVIEKQDTGTLLAFLDAQREQTLCRMEELRRTIRSIGEVEKTIRISQDIMTRNGVYRRIIPERMVVTLPYEGISDAGDAAVAYAGFDRLLESSGLTSTYGTGILFADGESGFVPRLLFNTVRIRDGSETSAISRIPAGNYVCIRYTERDALESSRDISRYCAENGLTPVAVVQADLLHDLFSVEPPAVELQIRVTEKP